MNHYLNISMLALIGFCIVTEAAREICFKSAANDDSALKTFSKPVVWLGIIFWAVEMVCWLYVLEKVPLSVAFPIMSLSYIPILFSGKFIFKEHLSRRHIIGAMLITFGVACVGITGI